MVGCGAQDGSRAHSMGGRCYRRRRRRRGRRRSDVASQFSGANDHVPSARSPHRRLVRGWAWAGAREADSELQI